MTCTAGPPQGATGSRMAHLAEGSPGGQSPTPGRGSWAARKRGRAGRTWLLPARSQPPAASPPEKPEARHGAKVPVEGGRGVAGRGQKTSRGEGSEAGFHPFSCWVKGHQRQSHSLGVPHVGSGVYREIPSLSLSLVCAQVDSTPSGHNPEGGSYPHPSAPTTGEYQKRGWRERAER